jgi:hypothetical protein
MVWFSILHHTEPPSENRQIDRKPMKRQGKRYSYSSKFTLLSIVGPAPIFLVGLVTLPYWAWTILSTLFKLTRGYMPTDETLRVLAVAWTPFLLGSFFLNQYTEIIVADQGMWVRVFLLKWVFVPWEDVLNITTTPSTYLPALLHLIQVRKLTVFHRLISITYRAGSKPSIVINGHMRNYQELLETIEKHIGQKPDDS